MDIEPIKFTYPAGEMQIDFPYYLKSNRYGINSVKKLLKLSDAENRALMLETVEKIMGEIQTEFIKLMDEYEKQITDINNKYLFEHEREKAKQPARKKCVARRKALNGRFEKLMKIRGLLENVE